MDSYLSRTEELSLLQLGSGNQPENWPRGPAMRICGQSIHSISFYEKTKRFSVVWKTHENTRKLPIWFKKKNVYSSGGSGPRNSLLNRMQSSEIIIRWYRQGCLCQYKAIWNQTNLTSCFSLPDILFKAFGEVVLSSFTG